MSAAYSHLYISHVYSHMCVSAAYSHVYIGHVYNHVYKDMWRLPQSGHSKQADCVSTLYVCMHMYGEMLGLA